jgi:uracil-DNA glycosylase family 4
MSNLPKWLLTKCEACRRCQLYKTRRGIVIGKGASPADILFIGEAPGKSEDIIGEPFIGASGKLLDLLLDEARKLALVNDNVETRSISYYVTNTILCRPTDVIGGDNRQPLPLEVAACAQNIMNIYKCVEPKIVVFVGKVAQKYYHREFTVNAAIMHPAFILRQGGQSSPLFLQTARILSNILITLTKEEV